MTMFVVNECWKTDFMVKIIIYHLVFNFQYIFPLKYNWHKRELFQVKFMKL